MGTFWEHLERKTASHVRERRFLYPEPDSKRQKLSKFTLSVYMYNYLFINI